MTDDDLFGSEITISKIISDYSKWSLEFLARIDTLQSLRDRFPDLKAYEPFDPNACYHSAVKYSSLLAVEFANEFRFETQFCDSYTHGDIIIHPYYAVDGLEIYSDLKPFKIGREWFSDDGTKYALIENELYSGFAEMKDSGIPEFLIEKIRKFFIELSFSDDLIC